MDLEEKMLEYTRRGEEDKARYIKNLDKSLLPSQRARVLSNDSSVWHELVVPKWLDFDMLREWIMLKDKPANREMCTFCNSYSENLLNLNGKYVCRECGEKIKEMV